MKGLFVKDLCLLRSQIKGTALIVIMGVSFSIMNRGVFGTGYMGVLAATLGLSTLSYDEYDHGYPFLFTLPFTKKEYITEKYITAALLGCAGTMLGACIDLLRGGCSPDEILSAASGVALVVVLMCSIMIPLRIKFDNEQGRTLSGVIMGLFIASAVLIGKLLPEDVLKTLADSMDTVNPAAGVAVLAAIAVAAVAVSYRISLKALETREF